MWLRDQLASGLGTDSAYVERLAHLADTQYRMASIPKRSGGMRTIWMPSPELKAAQRWLVRRILFGMRVHSAAAAYERGAAIHHNAQRHAASKYLMRLDLKKFFESISRADVCAFISAAGVKLNPHWSTADTELFADLACWRTHLVIGAVTSPSLTNRMCFELDKQLADLAEMHHVSFSRYADDLFFSTEAPNVLRLVEEKAKEIIAGLKVPSSLRVNAAKTRHLSKKQRRSVTGLVLTCTGTVSLGRSRKRKIRALIDQFDRLADSERTALQGAIAFCRDVEPSFIDRLALKYGAARVEQLIQWSAS